MLYMDDLKLPETTSTHLDSKQFQHCRKFGPRLRKMRQNYVQQRETSILIHITYKSVTLLKRDFINT